MQGRFIAVDRIATASTNGCVVLWDLSRPHRNKLGYFYNCLSCACAIHSENKYQLHERAIQKVHFHPSEPNQLLSCALDGYVKLIDFRHVSAAIVFPDSRYVSLTCTIPRTSRSATDGVRDVQFHKVNANMFAAAYESGDFQLCVIM